MHRHKYNQQHGFTLLELMITVALAGILLAVGVPSFGDIIKRNRLTAQSNSLLSALHLARNEAVNRGHNIRVLPISGTTDWTAGWQVRLDVDGENDIDAEDIILRSYDAIEGAILIGDAALVTYEASGFASAAVAQIKLTADQCTSTKEYIRVVSVKLSGLISSAKQTCP